MQALQGIRVLDLSRLLPGPFTTKLLRDMGARVDKLEAPGAGDYLRHMPPHGEDGLNPVFTLLNRGKRSCELDLKSESGRATLRELVKHYDVLVESFRPGVMERLGIGHAALLEENPELIICAITGYGQNGPMAKRAGHDMNFLARAGVLGFSGPSDTPPAVPGVQIADISGALYATIAIQGALLERMRTGKGQILDIALSESALSFCAFGLGLRAGKIDPGRGEDVLTGGLSVYGSYQTKDGGYVALCALEPKFWRAFCEGAGIDYIPDAIFPGEHQHERKAELRALFLTKTREEWAAIGEQHDCCLEPILEPAELLTCAQLQGRGLIPAFDMLGTPIAKEAGGEAPAHGEHSEEVLSVLGT